MYNIILVSFVFIYLLYIWNRIVVIINVIPKADIKCPLVFNSILIHCKN